MDNDLLIHGRAPLEKARTHLRAFMPSTIYTQIEPHLAKMPVLARYLHYIEIEDNIFSFFLFWTYRF